MICFILLISFSTPSTSNIWIEDTKNPQPTSQLSLKDTKNPQPTSNILFKDIKNQQPFWIKDTKSTFFEFETHLASLDSNHLSYGEHLLKLKREETKKFQLKNLVLKAQEQYLSGEVAPASELFKEINSLSHMADWNEEQRRAIFYSFLRRAQNEKNTHKRQALLLSAIQFKMDKLTKEDLDYPLFPPPLLEELNQIQKNQTLLSVPLKTLLPHHEIILINGRRIPKKTIKLPEASYRITALSSSHSSWTKVITLSHLMTQSIKNSPLTSGSCHNLKAKNQKENFKIFYNKNCTTPKYLSQKQNYENFFHKTSVQKDYKKSKFSKQDLPTWLLVGTAVITTGVLLSFTKKSSRRKNSQEVLF